MIKYIQLILLGVFIMMTACKSSNDFAITGKWHLKSAFYKASYKIFNEENELKAYLLSYDDGTSVYTYCGKKKHFLFQSLKKKKGRLVDATSGASQQENPKISLELLHTDTLLVTTYLMNKPLKEIWIRNNN